MVKKVEAICKVKPLGGATKYLCEVQVSESCKQELFLEYIKKSIIYSSKYIIHL